MSKETQNYHSWTIKEISFNKEDNTLFEMKCLLDEDNKTAIAFSQDEWYYSNVNRDLEDHSLPKVGDKLVFSLVSKKDIDDVRKIYNL